MEFRCPSCMKELTVQDEHAGQQMQCPLCNNTFQAPALPPPTTVAASSPDLEKTAKLLTSSTPEKGVSPRKGETKPEQTAKATEVAGDYSQEFALQVIPRLVPWSAPILLGLVFLLTFSSWVKAILSVEPVDVIGRGAWSLAFRDGNVLTILFLLLFVPTFVISLVIAAAELVPGFKVPRALQQIWPWRSALLALLILLSFLFLGLQAISGFDLHPEGKHLHPGTVHRTGVLGLVLLLYLGALIASLLDFWLEQRGPNRPPPRLTVSW